MPNVIKLDVKSPVPEGYIELPWETPPHQGRYAVKPKQWCDICNGTGRMTMRVQGSKVERHCNCVASRMLKYVSPVRAGLALKKKPSNGHNGHHDGNRETILKREIERLTVTVQQHDERLGQLQADRDAELGPVQADLQAVEEVSARLIEQSETAMTYAEALATGAERVLEVAEAETKRTMEEAKSKATSLTARAKNNRDKAEEAKKEAAKLGLDDQREAVKRLEKKWSMAIQKAGHGQARRDRRRLERLTNRLEDKNNVTGINEPAEHPNLGDRSERCAEADERSQDAGAAAASSSQDVQSQGDAQPGDESAQG